MEFFFDVDAILPHQITILDSISLKSMLKDESTKEVSFIIDQMGSASAMAQGLKVPVTSMRRMLSSPDQRIYIFKENLPLNKHTRVSGIVKVGKKSLYLRDHRSGIVKCKPLCVLDFYVSELCQRLGYGRRLFDCMLTNEKTNAHRLAYDRPSDKMLPFLKKHYGLSKRIPQSNNFAVFPSFFEDSSDDVNSVSDSGMNRNGTFEYNQNRQVIENEKSDGPNEELSKNIILRNESLPTEIRKEVFLHVNEEGNGSKSRRLKTSFYDHNEKSNHLNHNTKDNASREKVKNWTTSVPPWATEKSPNVSGSVEKILFPHLKCEPRNSTRNSNVAFGMLPYEQGLHEDVSKKTRCTLDRVMRDSTSEQDVRRSLMERKRINEHVLPPYDHTLARRTQAHRQNRGNAMAALLSGNNGTLSKNEKTDHFHSFSSPYMKAQRSVDARLGGLT